jgi:hypothetical protein
VPADFRRLDRLCCNPAAKLLEPDSYTSGGFSNVDAALSFVLLTQGFSVFLVAVVLLEIIIYEYGKRRLDMFAEETSKTLP